MFGHDPEVRRVQMNGKLWGGIAVAAAAAVVAFVLHDKSAEKPDYVVEQEDGALAVRAYPARLVAETVYPGAHKAALNAGFRKLAAFIYAKDRPDGDRRRIAMTAPVLSDQVRDGWRTRFFMPSDFSRDTLPRPDDAVVVTELPARRVGAIRFSGLGSDTSLAEHERRLRAWLAERRLTAAGAAEYAYYESPFVPPPLRRNEVLIPLEG